MKIERFVGYGEMERVVTLDIIDRVDIGKMYAILISDEFTQIDVNMVATLLRKLAGEKIIEAVNRKNTCVFDKDIDGDCLTTTEIKDVDECM